MGPNERWTAVASEVEGKTKKECAARAKERRLSVSAVAETSGDGAAVGADVVHSSPTILQRVQRRLSVGGPAELDHTQDSQRDWDAQLQPRLSFSTPGIVESAPAEAAANGEWSSEQQRQLEAALGKYSGATMGPNERWTSIASEVEGKTKKECAARAKERRLSVPLAATAGLDRTIGPVG